MKCVACKETAVVSLPSVRVGFCSDCFLSFFKKQVEKAIRREKLLTFDDKVLVALSGGKDSLALMLQLSELGYDVTGLFVDLAIPGSSYISRQTVVNFCSKHNFRLIVKDVSSEGLAIPVVKKYLKRPVCSVCGKIKRYFFNKVALEQNFTVLATGHNLDDEISRLFSNILRWDISYLSDQGPYLPAANGFARKIKPLFRLSEFEIANYAFIKGIEWHYAPCPYSQGATFTLYKNLWNNLEQAMPGRKLEFYLGFLKQGKEAFIGNEKLHTVTVESCSRCGYPTSNSLCGVCRIKDTLAEHV